MATIGSRIYRPRSYNLSGLAGISDETMEMHFKLYEGYVNGTNTLNEQITDLIESGQVASAAHSELTRRLGFEYNGMVLHQYYFGNLKRLGSGDPDKGSVFMATAEASFGSYKVWKEDFVAVGKMRGVGWAVCLQDPGNGRLSNHWISLHETGNVAGFTPVLVMDVWEHAYLLDYKPAERPKYIDAFFQNIDWDAVNGRLLAVSSARG